MVVVTCFRSSRLVGATVVHCMALCQLLIILPSIALARATPISSSTSRNNNDLSKPSIVQLQMPHPAKSPVDTLQELVRQCEELGISEWDVYGDFDKSNSFLRNFEAELAQEFEKEDAVFMPSGVMAQSIALLIHADSKKSSSISSPQQFVCHATSHLLLHEQDAYRELCSLQAISMPPNLPGTGLGAPPLLHEHILEYFETSKVEAVSTILLELPHRELGGKITPWEDIQKIQKYCKDHDIAFHCDGARIFEATTGYQKSLAELVAPFDSVYISFYKGLGGISGAMLMGSREFCEQARIWLRRFGGNLYTLLPYAVSGWSGYRKYWIQPRQTTNTQEPIVLSFQDKRDKLVRLAEYLQSNDVISSVLTLEPRIPQASMVHCYLRLKFEECAHIRDRIQDELGVSLFHRLRAIDSSEHLAFQEGYRCKFELSMGQANGSVPDEVWKQAWFQFGREASLVSLAKDES